MTNEKKIDMGDAEHMGPGNDNDQPIDSKELADKLDADKEG